MLGGIQPGFRFPKPRSQNHKLTPPQPQPQQDARAEMKAGTWLCPHCYEEDHPTAGWMCNSSICMKRRGFKPTGIAIYDAQQRGFASVAHWLQAQIKRRGAKGLEDGEEGAAAAAAGGVSGSGGSKSAGGKKRAAGAAASAAADCGKRVTRGCGSSGAAAAGGLETVVEDQGESDAAPRRATCRGSSGRDQGPAVPASAAGEGGKRRTRGAAAAAATATSPVAAAADANATKKGKATAAAAAAAAIGKKAAAATITAAVKAAAGKRRGSGGAASSREGSNEPFAQPTPTKRAAEVAAGGEARALRSRRV